MDGFADGGLVSTWCISSPQVFAMSKRAGKKIQGDFQEEGPASKRQKGDLTPPECPDDIES